MSFKLLIVSLLLGAASKSCYGQDLQGVEQNFQQHKDIRDILRRSNINEVLDGLDELDRLWTELFPRLVDEGSNFTQECINSTMNLLEHGPIVSFGNITLPVAGVILLDAAGKLGAGLLGGNVLLDGAFDECFNYNFTGYCVAEQVDLTIPGIPIPPTIVWTVGLCVPKHCGASDIGLAINSTKYLTARENSVRCTDSNTPGYNAGAIVMIFVCIVFLLLALIGSTVDVVTTYGHILFREKKVMVTSIDPKHNPSINDTDTPSEKSPLLTVETPKDKAKPLDFILAFSLFKNVPTLLATKQASSVITSLNGLRVISMFWVILGHTHFWLLTGNSARLDNMPVIPKVMSRLSFQVLVNGFFSVDTFFFLSGVLVAYLTLRQMKKKKGRFPFVHYYIHRYLRITPAYAFVLFFAWFLTNHLAYGPILMKNPFADNCAKKWWTNLLYINNLYPWKMNDACVGWSWYLANDMQFYILSPLILIPIYYLFPAGLAVASGFIFAGLLISMSMTIVFNFQGNTFAMFAYNFTTDSSFTFQDSIYTKPWDRISPYVVGLVLGYILYKRHYIEIGRKRNILVYLLGWIFAGIIMWWTLYGLIFTWHGHTPSRFENVIYIMFYRVTWVIGLSLIVFACHNGYGWFINSFLSMPIWTPLSRMTFNAYLVHPIVLSVVYGQYQTSIHYTDVTMAMYAIAFVVLSYGVAGVVCLFVEFPLGTIEMLVFKLFGSFGRESQRQSQGDVCRMVVTDKDQRP